MLNRDRNVLGLPTTTGGTVTSTNAALIAQAEYYISESTSSWTECVVELDYGAYKNVDGVTVENINVIFAANDYFADRSTIVSGNSLSVQSVELLYYHALSSLSYEGATLAFDENTMHYDLSTFEYDESKLSYVKKGQGATVTHSYDDATALLTIRVQAEDYNADTNSDAFTEYTIQFGKAVVTDFTEPLLVSVDGYGMPPQSTTFKLIEEIDDSYSFALDNFCLGEMPIGNIVLRNLTKSGNRYSCNQDVIITAGSLDGVTDWYGPNLGEVPIDMTATQDGAHMTAVIDIDMRTTLGQVIRVVLAPEATVTDTTAPTVTGLTNVTLTRAFKLGWNTICLPFDYTLLPFGEGAVAQEFTSVAEGLLNFTEVTTGELKANVPYLLYLPTEVAGPLYFGVEVQAATPTAVTYGDFTFQGTYAPMSMAGLMGVTKIDGVDKVVVGGAGATIKGTRAYFTSTSGIKEMLLSFDGVVTGIESLTGTSIVKYDVFTLTGVQVRKQAVSLAGLPKGIYIVNGKKMVVE